MQSCTACRHAELLSPYIACTCNDGFGNWVDSGFIDLSKQQYSYLPYHHVTPCTD